MKPTRVTMDLEKLEAMTKKCLDPQKKKTFQKILSESSS